MFRVAAKAAIELQKILYKGGTGIFTQAAVELLGKGFAAWRACIFFHYCVFLAPRFVLA